MNRSASTVSVSTSNQQRLGIRRNAFSFHLQFPLTAPDFAEHRDAIITAYRQSLSPTLSSPPQFALSEDSTSAYDFPFANADIKSYDSLSESSLSSTADYDFPFSDIQNFALYDLYPARRASSVPSWLDDGYAEEVHNCLTEDNDPFVGILTEYASNEACCTYKSYLKISPERAVPTEAYYTPFGSRLQQIDLVHELELRVSLSDFWLYSWNSGVEAMRAFLKENVNHTDEDKVQWHFDECSVCLVECRLVRTPPCCKKSICQICWRDYVQTTAKNSMSVHMTGMYDLHCFGCDKFVPYSQALASLSTEELNAVRPPGHTSCSVARCPVCLKVPPPLLFVGKSNEAAKLTKKLRKKRGGRPLICDRCHNTFCGICGISDHPTMSCNQLTASDVGLRKWSKQKSIGRPEFKNARRCPKCLILFSHSGGCPHMTCPCGAEWCFTCGRRHLGKPLTYLLPGHRSNRMLPLVSCPKLWDSQPKRIAVHSLISVGILTGAVPVLAALSPILFPVGLGFFLKYKLKHRH